MKTSGEVTQSLLKYNNSIIKVKGIKSKNVEMGSRKSISEKKKLKCLNFDNNSDAGASYGGPHLK
jgi:hypothetical protein